MKDWLYDVYVAHRGLHDEKNGIVENTLPAFAAAVEKGYNIELDVQLTRDGKLVVFHDDNLERVTGVKKFVDEIDYEDLKQNVRFLANPDPSVYVPLFSEVLELCRKKVGIMIEIKKKSNAFYDYKVERALRRELKGYDGDFIVKSFNPYSVDYFRRVEPSYRRGFLCCVPDLKHYYNLAVAEKAEEILFDEDKRVEFFDYAVWNMDEKPLFKRVKEDGKLKVIVWTVARQETADRYAPYYDNMIFENFIPKEVK